MSIRIRYKGVESEEFPLIQMTPTFDAERTLLTAGRYCEDDITILSNVFPTTDMYGDTKASNTIQDELGINAISNSKGVSFNLSPELDNRKGYYELWLYIKTAALPASYTVTWIDPNDNTDVEHSAWTGTDRAWTYFVANVSHPARVFDPVRFTITADNASSVFDLYYLGIAKNNVNNTNITSHLKLGLVFKTWFLACAREVYLNSL